MKIAAIIFAVFTLGYLVYLISKNKYEISKAFKGADGDWQVPELLACLWCFLFIVLFYGDLMFSMTVSDNIWLTLNGMWLTIMATYGFNQHIQGKGKDNSKSEGDSE